LQTKGLSLEEINEKFGDQVVVQLEDGAAAETDVENLKLKGKHDGQDMVEHKECASAETETADS
jgi:hypothetical protein